MFSDKIDGNSVLGYSYTKDSRVAIEGFDPNDVTDSGTRGAIIGAKDFYSSAGPIIALDGDTPVPVEIEDGKSYRIKFDYTVVSVEEGSIIKFSVCRGLNQTGWATKYPVDSDGSALSPTVVFASAAMSTKGNWFTAEYTFTATISEATKNYKYLQIGGAGFGEAYMDNFYIEEIDASEVVPVPDTSMYEYSLTDIGTISVDGYTGTATDLTIPKVISGAPVSTIGEFGFIYDRHVKNITLQDGVTTISNWAFENARVLETVSIPATVTSIGKLAFNGTKKLTAINVDAESQSFKSIDGVLYSSDMSTLVAYPAGKIDTEFTVPDDVKVIAENAFAYAASLQTVTLPEGLTTIGDGAFSYCSALTTINIPAGITSLGKSVFRNCSALTGLDIGETVTDGENTFLGCDNLFTVGNIDSSDTAIGTADALKLTQYLANMQNSGLTRFEAKAADINGNGKVDMMDIAILRRHLAGWNGYDALPTAGRPTESPVEYNSSSETPELVINLTNNRNDLIEPNRDISYDKDKEDVAIILVIGQSNSTFRGVGYSSEYDYYVEKGNGTEDDITAAPTRPDKGTVYSGKYVSSLKDTEDLYNLTDPSRGKGTFSGYTPAIGKQLHEATGAKVVLVQCALGATGMHEWTRNPESYDCSCGETGQGILYHNAVKNFTKTYQKLAESYNIVSTGYIWNQGEHEQVYNTSKDPVQSELDYYNIFSSMHNALMEDCELDFGGIVMPRSYYGYHTGWQSSRDAVTFDNEQHSRYSTFARHALYRAANEMDNVYLMSTWAEKVTYETSDPINPNDRIHYSQIAYNNIGTEAGNSIATYTDNASASTFTGITVYNADGVELAKFDANGELVSGSSTVAYTEDGYNSKLQIKIEPLGTYYTYDLTEANLTGFVDEFGCIDWSKFSGEKTFKIVVNAPVK